VPVDLRRDAGVLVPHDLLYRRQVGALHEQQRRRRVAQVVEADLPDLADGEQPELALRAVDGVGVGRGFVVPAALAPALVDVARHQAGPSHRPPEHVLERRVLRQHRPVVVGEHQLGWRGRDRLPEVRHQLLIDRHRLHPPALRDVAVVRAADHDDAGVEVDVALSQREQLALAQPRVDRRGEEGLPLRLERRDQGLHLLWPQVVRQPLHHLPLRHVGHRVRPRELLHPPRHRERPAQVPAQVVDALRAQGVFLIGQEQVDLAGGHLGEPQPAEPRPDDVLADAGRARVRRRPLHELVDPPRHHLVDRPTAVLEIDRVVPETLPLEPGLLLDRERLRLLLRGGLRGHAPPPPGGIDHLQVPGAPLQVDRRHSYVPSAPASSSWPPKAFTSISIALPPRQSTVLSRRRTRESEHLGWLDLPPGERPDLVGLEAE